MICDKLRFTDVVQSDEQRNANTHGLRDQRSRGYSSLMKIIGELPHSWPQTSLLTVAHTLFCFLHEFRVLKHR